MQAKLLLAGPYELTSRKNKDERITLCIVEGNEVSMRKYKANKAIMHQTEVTESFEKAMDLLEKKIAAMKDEFVVKGDEKDGPPAAADKKKAEPKKLLGKRSAKDPEPLKAASAAPTKAQAKAEEKKEKKESKEEEKQLPTRKSARNEGKVANYNIDDILDAHEAELNGGVVVTGGKVSGGHI